ncbi:MAG: ATP-binding protein, partial [Candidatus Korarchaeota archaeon NZ13-K]
GEAILELKRVNLVLGPPESGKSNLLEALAPFTLLGQLSSYEKSGIVLGYESEDEVRLWDLKPIFTKLTRIRRKEDPFFMFSVDEPATVRLEMDGLIEAAFTYSPEALSISYRLEGEEFMEVFRLSGYNEIDSVTASRSALSRIDELEGRLPRVKFYRFSSPERVVFWGEELIPPDGPNLMHVLGIRGGLRRIVSSLLDDVGLRLSLEVPSKRVMFLRFLPTGEVLGIRDYMLSDTLRRLIFFLAAIETNRKSLVLMEEPEAHAFPFYVKFLAERLAMNESNSYIITTHNPYFLETIVDKVPDADLSVYVARNEGGVSEFRSLEASEIREIIAEGADVFMKIGDMG